MQRVLLFILFCLPACCFAQSTFQQVLHINGSATEADGIVATSSGGYALAGVVNIGGNVECFLSKYNSSGVQEWTKIYYDQQSHLLLTGVNDTEIFCFPYVRFLLNFDNGFVLGGGIDSSVSITYPNGITVVSDYSRQFAIHTDADGNLLWSKKFVANEYAFAEEAIALADGSLLLAGAVNQTGMVLRDIALWKLNAGGDVLWARSYGGSFDEGVAHVVEASPGQWMVCGTSESFSNNMNIYVLNTDSSGQLNWSNVYGTTGFDYGKGLVKMDGNSYYVYGNAGNGNPSYIALLKLDSAGVLQWANTCGNFLFDSPQDLFLTPGGNLVMLADHYAASHDALACEVDVNGNWISSRIFGKTNPDQNDFISSMIAEPSGYVFAGETNSFSTNQLNEGYLIRTHNGLESDCFSDSIDYAPTALALTTTAAATSVSLLNASSYPMLVTVLDSTMLSDTLCFSVITTVAAPASEYLNVFPNPAHDELTMTSSPPIQHVNCFNEMGEMIFSADEEYVSEIHFETSVLAEGIYFLEIKTSGKTFYQKVIVVH